MTDDVLRRAEQRLQIAHHILADLQLLAQWQAFGTPYVVGAVAYDLVVAPDIDIEVFCETMRIEDGFEILRDCALHPRVHGVRFRNHLNAADQGLYWQIQYEHSDGQMWKVDMWSLPNTHPGPYAARIVAAMRTALTPKVRATILALKEEVQANRLAYPSIAIYQAAIDDGITTLSGLVAWMYGRDLTHVTAWAPRVRHEHAP